MQWPHATLSNGKWVGWSFLVLKPQPVTGEVPSRFSHRNQHPYRDSLWSGNNFPRNGGFWFMPRELLQHCRARFLTCPTSAQLPLTAETKGASYCSQKLSHKQPQIRAVLSAAGGALRVAAEGTIPPMPVLLWHHSWCRIPFYTFIRKNTTFQWGIFSTDPSYAIL